jgi:site-specific DNA-methyltransferase (adenine-specific)|tara:strand:+ start:12594 stop:13214 length:621 start_codon:yes stop_codon:yes gene_type:complete
MNITNEDNMELMARYEDNYFDLAIVDPPYGLERLKKGSLRLGGTKGNYKDSLKWDNKPLQDYWNELFRVSKNQIVWGANNFVMPPSEYFCIWNKKQTVDNFATAEYAWVSMGLKKPAKMFDYSIHKHNHTDKIHPTEKPVKLYEWLLINYAKEGDKILDTHLGSGSIAIACHNLGFDLTACELDTEYFKAATKRLKQHTQQLRITI